MQTIATYKIDHLLGTQVGTSTLIKELARGGMAIVFIAFQRTLKRQIAVKILPKSLLTPKAAELFQQEAETVAILSHPNIIPVYEVGDTEEFLYFTMQLIHGNALSHYIQAAKKNPIPSRRTLPLQTTLKVIIQVLDALDYAHSMEMVHRDIKPGNILVEGRSKRPIVTDFGIVQVVSGGDNKPRAAHGTPLFMAPEQILGKEVDGRADIYAVGVMLFQMLVPALPLPPFRKKTDLLKHKVISKSGMFIKQPSEVNPVLKKEMDIIVSKATARDPSQRYSTCREFLDDLEAYQRQYAV